jgi:hypothetical protein
MNYSPFEDAPEYHESFAEVNGEGLLCDALFGIFQWGELKHKGTKEDCERIAKRWTEQNGNLDLEVIPLPNADVEARIPAPQMPESITD